MNETNNDRGNNTFTNWVLGIVSVLLVALIIGAVGAWNSTSERMAVIEYQLQQQSQKEALDDEQSRSIEKLWKAAAQNKAAINNRHKTDDVPYHEWKFDD